MFVRINPTHILFFFWNLRFRMRICILSFAIFSFACSSIQKLDEKSYLRTPLVLKPMDVNTEIPVESSMDPRLRKVNKLVPDIWVHFPEEEWSGWIPKEKAYFQREILRRLPRSNAHIHLARLDASKLDGILTIVPQSDPASEGQNSGRVYRFLARLIDPVLDLEYYRTYLQWNSKEAPSQILVFWMDSNHIFTPRQAEPPPERVLFPEDREWNEAFQSVVMGKLNIYASSSDTTLRINGEPVGEVPLRDFPILNGIHRVEFQRPGFETIVRSIQIRAGMEKNLIHEWEEDRNKASIQIQSFPQGLDVWVNSSRKGVSNYYESELLPGAKRIWLGKSLPSDSGVMKEYLYAEGTAVLPSGTLSCFALPYNLESALSPENSEFWRPVGEKGFRPVYDPYLGFANTAPVLVPGDYGYISSYIFPMSLKWEGVWGELPSDGSRLLLVLMGEDRNLGLESFGEEFALFDWDANGRNSVRSLGVWKFKANTKPEDRKFRFEFRKDNEKSMLTITLGNRKIYSTAPPKGEFWRIGILTRGEKFRAGPVLQRMKLEYPDLVEWEKRREKKQ